MGSLTQHSGSAPSSPSSPRGGLLENRTLLDHPEDEFRVKLYPSAGEATLFRVPWWYCLAPRFPRNAVAITAPREPGDPCRRAAGRVRRYVRANHMRYLWTATYADACSDRAQCQRDVYQFQRRFKRRFGRLPLVVVPEQGRGGARGSTEEGNIHIHFAADRFLSIEKVREVWGHGYVFVGDPKKLPGKVGPRKLASYLAKYISKQIDADLDAGLVFRSMGSHRYYVTQGFQPELVRRAFRTQAEAYRWLRGAYGRPDVEIPVGDPATDGVAGYWFSYPDRCIRVWLDAWLSYVRRADTWQVAVAASLVD